MKVNEILLEARRDQVILVDFQPAYATFNPGVYNPALHNAIEYINQKKPNVLAFFNGSDVGIEDTKDEVLDHFIENGLDEDSTNLFTFREKSYAWLRNWMDVGIDASIIIAVVRYMVNERVNDSRDIEEYEMIEILGQDVFDQYEEYLMSEDPIFIPDINIAELKSLSGALMGGGAEHECLKEIQLLMNAFNIKYKLVQDWIYG